jgi:hypothetical protein
MTHLQISPLVQELFSLFLLLECVKNWNSEDESEHSYIDSLISPQLVNNIFIFKVQLVTDSRRLRDWPDHTFANGDMMSTGTSVPDLIQCAMRKLHAWTPQITIGTYGDGSKRTKFVQNGPATIKRVCEFRPMRLGGEPSHPVRRQVGQESLSQLPLVRLTDEARRRLLKAGAEGGGTAVSHDPVVRLVVI